MTTEQKINMALAHAGISQAELARRLGTSPQNLHQRIKRGALRMENMEKIAEACGGEWVAEIRFSDGTAI